ncbi:MAG: acetate kinase [Clostridiales Family XIII bacterium]|jgi:acetate kinase|nr:acetate kinase [Clostridiales Family XIII bacterium]
MKVLVINCGSSSLKYQLLDMTTESLLAKGLVERIGLEGSVLKHEKTIMEDKMVVNAEMNDHKEAIAQVIDALMDPVYGVVKSMDDIGAVGHRVVHAGEYYSASVIIDKDVIKALEACIELAPLHNPPNLLGIAACREIMPGTPQIAVFDTAFHQTMPPESYIYAIPYEYYEKYGIRRYGFHGTSHKYVADRAAYMLGVSIDDLKIITCHLGNGASISAIKRGKCIDTSMGFTPLAGLAMGTRSGSVDPAIIQFIVDKENRSVDEMLDILNKKSGMLGVSGVSSDFRDLDEAVKDGNERAALALQVFAHRVRYYIGAYMAEMNGLDALVFTAGVGENDVGMRDVICNELGNLGIKLDPVRNRVRGREAVISRDDSRVAILMIPTNEELVIARDTYSLANKKIGLNRGA